jgi:hypothetical protein
MSVSSAVRERLKQILWDRADQVDWSQLPDGEKAQYYELWTRDKEIGGALAHFMDPRQVRVYIKDSLLKPYERQQLSVHVGSVMEQLGVAGVRSIESFIKPHGRCLIDGRVVAWGKSRDWKLILMAVFERALVKPGRAPYAAALFETGKSVDVSTRALIKEAGRRLQIQSVVWIDE